LRLVDIFESYYIIDVFKNSIDIFKKGGGWCFHGRGELAPRIDSKRGIPPGFPEVLYHHLMIVTGFALLSEFHHGLIWKILGGWRVPFVSFQTLRLIHHFMMWLFVAFAILHVYAGWFIDSIEKNSIIDSIFSGYKIVHE
jgi:hypothetical protein